MPQSPLLADLRPPLVLAGAGKMGGALLSGWIAQGLHPSRVIVIDPFPPDEIRSLTAQGLTLNPAVLQTAATLVIAIKPQTFAEAGPALRSCADASTLVISIMAGITIDSLDRVIGGAIVRAMPNTPATIGRGISVAIAAPNVSDVQRNTADALLRAAGGVEWIGEESLMDAVTAVSGSGPAYVFLLAEELAKAGVTAGLPLPLATRLARDTVSGAGDLLRMSHLDSATLRENVTSPNGTTAAALEVLMGETGFAVLLAKAVDAATKRSRELAR